MNEKLQIEIVNLKNTISEKEKELHGLHGALSGIEAYQTKK